ncbi:MAG: DHHA1 domain-containing protein [Heliobacteriaceae bacterium]|nr:DHHA1 domain-containing protein [Heliobacteriaceae bacterium]
MKPGEVIRWQQYGSQVPAEISRWLAANRMPVLFAPALYGRGVQTVADLAAFFSCSLATSSSPLLFGENLHRAVARLRQAMEGREKIVVFSDYDADGTTGAALIAGILGSLQHHYGFELAVALGDRFSDGYGLNQHNIGRVCQMNPDLVVTVDCGIGSHQEIVALKQAGADTIVTDHHEPKGSLPAAAAAILHPGYCRYSFAALSGCGVAYQLMKGLWIAHGKKCPGWVVEDPLDLVAIGAVCDVMPLNLPDNRVYVKEGINRIRRGSRLAFQLMGQQLKWKKVDAHTLGFLIGPRINAAGRMGNADIVVDLLLSRAPEVCRPLLAELERRNNERRTQQKRVVDDGSKQLAANPYKHLTLVHGDFHAGVVGIAAAKFVSENYRPAFVFSTGGDQLKGSARSIPGVNLFKLIEKNQQYLTAWGGHAMAAGLTIPAANVSAFFQALDQELAMYPAETWEQVRCFDGVLTEADLTEEFFRTLVALEPFGEQFPALTWQVDGVLSGKELDAERKIGRIRIGKREFPFVMWEGAGKATFGEQGSFFGRWEWSDYHQAMQFRILDVGGRGTRVQTA